jgi:hypothetical protein
VQIVENVAIAAAFSKTEVFAAISLGALAMVTFPAISSLKANHVGAGEQGQIQGALVGAQSLAGGLGPLLFSYIFKLFSTCDHARPSLKTQTFNPASAIARPAEKRIRAYLFEADGVMWGGVLDSADSPYGLPYLPSAPFIVGSLMLVVALAVAIDLCRLDTATSAHDAAPAEAGGEAGAADDNCGEVCSPVELS